MQYNTEYPSWLYNEFQFSGVDYDNIEIARKFESRHRQFRDFDAEFKRICDRTHLRPSDVVLDLGCGSGAFVIPAAQYCKKVYGVDVSKPMLTLLQEKLTDQKITNVELIHDGFLTYHHTGNPVDVVVSSIALHHLPDFWKAVALQKIADILQPNGVFYLLDVIFSFPIKNWQSGVQKVLDAMSAAAGREANQHIASEFSSFDWYLEGLFERVGFEIEQVYDDASFLRCYVCRKKALKKQGILPSITSEQARMLDVKATQQYKIPSLLLMENAARSISDIFLQKTSSLYNEQNPYRILICCGKGNNGGDGLALFRRFITLGLECRLIVLGRPEEYVGDAKTNLEIALAISKSDPSKIYFLEDSPEAFKRLESNLNWCNWVFDALLGTGAKGVLRPLYAQIVKSLNASQKPICAIDIPTGLDPNTGEVVTTAIQAKMTISLAAFKKGLLVESSKDYVGELHIGDIGIPIAPVL